MAKAKHYRLVLIRAGSTAWDEDARLAGRTDLPLCTAGRADADAAADTVSSLPMEVVLSAPDEGSRETAAKVASVSRAKVRAVEGLAEPDMGLWEGLQESDLRERYPTAFGRWKDDPTSVSPPEGEDYLHAETRVVDTLRAALEKLGGEHPAVAIVLRPLALAILRAWLLDDSPARLMVVGTEVPAVEWHRVDRARLQEFAGATASRR